MNKHNIPVNALYLIKGLLDNGYSAYLVGGCVRDLFMGNIPNDYDICTNALPNEIIDIISKLGCKYIDTGIKYGTVVAMIHGEQYEITTYRLDGLYTDSRHPEDVDFTTSIEDDLARRDFTINAIAYNPYTDDIIDIYDGIQDIQDKKIRAVGDADKRFKEDALRILRGLRFAIKYKFDIEIDTLDAMKSNVQLIDNISKERITNELYKILTCGKDISYWFNRCDYIITQIIPEIKNCVNFNQNNKYHHQDVYNHSLSVVDNCKTTKFEIKLAALLHDLGKPDCYTVDSDGHGHFYGHPERSYEIAQEVMRNDLRLSNSQSELVLDFIRYHDIVPGNTKKSAKKLLNRFGIDFMTDWFCLKQADIDDHINITKNKYDLELMKILIAEVIDEGNCFTLKNLAINGNDVMNHLKIKQGKEIGMILNELLQEVIDDVTKNNKDDLLKRIDILGKKYTHSN